MRCYSIDTLDGDHLYYEIAADEIEAMGNHGSNVTVTDIIEFDDYEYIIENELDESEDIISELKMEYGLL